MLLTAHNVVAFSLIERQSSCRLFQKKKVVAFCFLVKFPAFPESRSTTICRNLYWFSSLLGNAIAILRVLVGASHAPHSGTRAYFFVGIMHT